MLPGLKEARALSLRTVVSDMSTYAPGMLASDFKLVASIYDIEETVAAAIKFSETVAKIDGVICMAIDAPLTMAKVAEALGLNRISVETAKIVSDKYLMKDVLSKHKINLPWYSLVADQEELNKLAHEKGLPLVVKPTDNRGARGVLLITTEVQLKEAFEYAFKNSPSGKVIVEEYLDGHQLSTESLVINGNVYTIGYSDRNYEFLEKYAPFIIENGGDLPAQISDDIRLKIDAMLDRVAKSINIKDGVIKGDIVIQDGEPYVIEVATRLSGGYFCSHEIPLNTGVNFVQNAIKIAMGFDPDIEQLKPSKNDFICQRFIFPEIGIVKSIKFPEGIEDKKDVEFFEIRIKVGDEIGAINSHPARVGLVITRGDSPEQARKLAEEIINSVQIEIFKN